MFEFILFILITVVYLNVSHKQTLFYNNLYTSVCVTNEYNASQTCTYCFQKLFHPVQTVYKNDTKQLQTSVVHLPVTTQFVYLFKIITNIWYSLVEKKETHKKYKEKCHLLLKIWINTINDAWVNSGFNPLSEKNK